MNRIVDHRYNDQSTTLYSQLLLLPSYLLCQIIGLPDCLPNLWYGG